jgi:AAA15 family ATPase/GTPase
MGHVESVEISGFKCLRSVSLECGQLNLITGRNGTGKSSVLEAIELAHSPSRISKFEHRSKKLVNINRNYSDINVVFENSEKEVKITSLATQEWAAKRLITRFITGLVERVKTPHSDVDIDEITEISQEDAAQIPTSILKHFVIIEQNNNLGLYTPSSDWVEDMLKALPNVPAPNDENFDLINNAISNFFTGGEFISGGIKDKNIKMVDSAREERSIVDENGIGQVRVRDFLRDHDIFPDLESFSFDELVFDEDGEQYAIPYDFLGDGTKTIIGIVWELVADDEIPDVVLLEEPENHLHPGYVKELVPFLIDFAREEDVQLFITSHNVDFISEFLSESLSEDHREWLTEEFRLTQMTELSPKQFDYDEAKHHTEELHLDLRGL